MPGPEGAGSSIEMIGRPKRTVDRDDFLPCLDRFRQVWRTAVAGKCVALLGYRSGLYGLYRLGASCASTQLSGCAHNERLIYPSQQLHVLACPPVVQQAYGLQPHPLSGAKSRATIYRGLEKKIGPNVYDRPHSLTKTIVGILFVRVLTIWGS